MNTSQHLWALTELVHAIRTDWDRPGITAALGRAAGRLTPHQLDRAAIDAAHDPTARTPAAITRRDGHAWHQQPLPPAQPPPIATLDLGRRDPATARRGAAAARAALQESQP